MANDSIEASLVVDDDPIVGKSFDRVLSPKGYAVISAANGAEALARLEAESYDMVYADIKIPGMDGIEVARRIKAARPWLPVVIVTRLRRRGQRGRRRARFGVADFLKKPLSPETIEGSAHFAFSAVALPAPKLPASPLVKNAGFFFPAPFIGLAFIVAVPFLGAGLVAITPGVDQVKIGRPRDANSRPVMRARPMRVAAAFAILLLAAAQAAASDAECLACHGQRGLTKSFPQGETLSCTSMARRSPSPCMRRWDAARAALRSEDPSSKTRRVPERARLRDRRGRGLPRLPRAPLRRVARRPARQDAGPRVGAAGAHFADCHQPHAVSRASVGTKLKETCLYLPRQRARRACEMAAEQPAAISQ